MILLSIVVWIIFVPVYIYIFIFRYNMDGWIDSYTVFALDSRVVVR